KKEEVKPVVPPVVAEVKKEEVPEIKSPSAVSASPVTDVPKKAEEKLVVPMQAPVAQVKTEPEMVRGMLPTKMIPARVRMEETGSGKGSVEQEKEKEKEQVAEVVPVIAKQTPATESGKEKENEAATIEPLISPVYTDDYFMQQGEKISPE